MGHGKHLSRRELLRAIPVVSGSSLLLPQNILLGQKPDTRTPGIIRGSITDAASGRPAAAKVRVTNTASGEVYMPEKSIKTMPQRTQPGTRHYFYTRGDYELAVPPGRYQVEAVRGINHDVATDFVEVGAGLNRRMDFAIAPLKDLQASGYYSGNTHTHYHLEIDEDPDDRLRLVPPAEALDVSCISYLIRNDSPYITNKYPIGRLPEFSRDGTLIDMGEEARNNSTFGGFGYGHCLFLNIPRLVEPVSTGLLSKTGKSPDFPTLSMLCEEARKIGGTTVWCHNGSGVELPVAAALGHVDAYNLGDGLEADYARYYQLLNCGIRLPASCGTDWWIYDHNRVYVKVKGSFTYDSWIDGLRAGRTFVTNGPLLEVAVDGKEPGATVNVSGEKVRVTAKAVSRFPFDRIEIVRDGEVVAEQSAVEGREAVLERELRIPEGGWLAARVISSARTHALYRVFAHSSPIYLRVADTPSLRASAAGAFVDEVGRSERLIRKTFHFESDRQRALALGRFEQGRAAFAKLVK